MATYYVRHKYAQQLFSHRSLQDRLAGCRRLSHTVAAEQKCKTIKKYIYSL